MSNAQTPKLVERLELLSASDLKKWDAENLDEEQATKRAAFYWSGVMTYLGKYWGIDAEGQENGEPSYNLQEANNVLVSGTHNGITRMTARICKPLFPHAYGYVNSAGNRCKKGAKDARLRFYGKLNMSPAERKAKRGVVMAEFRKHLAKELEYQETSKVTTDWSAETAVDRLVKQFKSHAIELTTDSGFITAQLVDRIIDGLREAELWGIAQDQQIIAHINANEAVPPADTAETLKAKKAKRDDAMHRAMATPKAKPKAAAVDESDPFGELDLTEDAAPQAA